MNNNTAIKIIEEEIGFNNKSIPSLKSIFTQFKPFPEEAVIFGVCAEDQLPVMFDVSDSHTPNIIVWENIKNQGMNIIKTAVEFILRYKRQSLYRTEFIIISDNMSQWSSLEKHGLGVGQKDECVAILPFHSTVVDNIITLLEQFANDYHGAKKPVFLFVDGFEKVLNMEHTTLNSLAWLMVNGRNKNIYVVGTSKIENRPKIKNWVSRFGLEIFGIDNLLFQMKEGDGDIFFWCPTTTI